MIQKLRQGFMVQLRGVHGLLVDLLYELNIVLPRVLLRLRVKLSNLRHEPHHRLPVCLGRIDVPLLHLLYHARPLLHLALPAVESLEHYLLFCSHAGLDRRGHLVEVLLLLL